MRKTLAALAVAALMLFAVPTAASADGYTPDPPAEPTLAGSTAVGECDGDVPYIFYSIDLTDPDHLSTSNFARLVISNASESVSIDLGELENGKLSGRILWPGASVDANGAPTGWPGWAFVDGKWVETDDNFRWTRGAISAKIEVNPEVSIPLSYPPATPVCATDPSNPDSPAGGLPATGMSADVLSIGIAGGAIALLGVVFLVARRRHS